MTPAEQSFKHILTSPWLLVFAALLSFYLNIWGFPLFDVDEGAFSEATREMIDSGNYAATYLNGKPRYDKPILSYWAQAASILTFGQSEFAFRLPSAIAATLWMLALFRFVRSQLDKETAYVAALVFSQTLIVTVIGKAATADAILNLFLALTFLDMYRYSVDQRRSLLLRVYLWMGLGFLTKGPVAVVLPFICSAVFYISFGRLREWLRAIVNPAGWLVFLVVAVPWYVVVYLDQGTAFFEGFIFKHNVGRFTNTMEGHGGNLLYYVFLLPVIMLPFTGWLAGIILHIKQMLKDPLDRYLWIWFAVVFIIFSFSQTQLPHYLLYGLTPLFILLAKHRNLLRQRWLAYAPVLLFFMLLISLPYLIKLAQSREHQAGVTDMLQQASLIFNHYYFIGVLALVILLCIILFSARKLQPWQGLILCGFLQTLLLSITLIPGFGKLQQVHVKEAAAIARSLDAPVVSYHTYKPSFSVYRRAITPEEKPVAGDLVFMRSDRLEQFANEYAGLPQQILYKKGGIVLIRLGDS